MPEIFWLLLFCFFFFPLLVFFFRRRKEHVLVFLGLGSNVGDRERFLSDALSHIAHLGKDMKVSRIWESLPWGGVAKFPFLNSVISFRTTLSPESLLVKIQSIEEGMGRDRKKEERWGERCIDIDILFYGDILLQTDILTIPHRYAHKRAFVLFPLSDIAPDFYFFQQKKMLSQVLKVLSEEEKKSVWIFSPEKSKK